MDDIRSHSRKRLATILKDPKHPMHSAAKAEMDRRAMNEKTLTPAEKKKREEIAKAMERENPGMDMSKKMAIATAAAKRVAEATDADYHKTLGPTKNSDEGIAALKKKHGMTHDQAKATIKRLMGEDTQLDELKKSTLANYIKKASDDRTKNAYDVGKSGELNFKGLKRRQGINRAVNKLTKEENISEVLDTPEKAINYKQRAKYSRDRAANSQAAHSLRGTDPSKDQDTERKRMKGLKSYDKLVTRKTFKALRGKK